MSQLPGTPYSPTSTLSEQWPGKWEWAEQQDEKEKREEDIERQETGKRKHNPTKCLLISNGNIWKCTLPLATHTLDRGQATSEKRQNGGKLCLQVCLVRKSSCNCWSLTAWLLSLRNSVFKLLQFVSVCIYGGEVGWVLHCILSIAWYVWIYCMKKISLCLLPKAANALTEFKNIRFHEIALSCTTAHLQILVWHTEMEGV